MRRAAVIAGCLGGLASAMPAAALCTPDRMSAAERRDFGFDPAADWFPLRADRPAPGWVFYATHERPAARQADGRYDRDSTRLVLEHCASRERLVAGVGAAGLSERDYSARYEALSFGIFNRASSGESRTYTLEDLADWARAQGFAARVDRAGYVSCVCAGERSGPEGG